ncbi:hypothetical protein B0H15DRAFT_954284 [Mycena belliarum]|uniref:Uncharacterized protein n=1 Tax=Mycena belliarum TaxID=1033014 RepID=A0AAD6XLP6_9AGAR|nr:hypothetical protein B0H15DRAFT_954284 [Mycena belliae]
MSSAGSTLISLASRKIRYSGSRCYNEKSELMPCPMSRASLIVTAILVSLFLLSCLAIFLLTHCQCRRRRSLNTVPITGTFYRTDPEFQPAGPYRQITLPASSMETLVEPEKTHPAMHPYHAY